MIRWIIVLLLVALPGIARADWHEASSKHFVVYSDEKPERLQAYAEELEKFDKAMRVKYGVRDDPVSPANRVTVFVLPSERMVQQLAGSSVTAGFYIPRAGANIAIVPRGGDGNDPYDVSARAVLRHEYAHHFMFSLTASALPMWFTEGFAEFWSTARYERDGSMLVGAAPAHRGTGLFMSNPLPVKRMLTHTGGKLTDEAQEAIYGRGWLLTHLLMFSTERQGQLPAYIAAINRGETMAKAAEAFGDLNKLERDLRLYMNQRRISATRVFATALTTDPVRVRKLTAGEAATILIRARSQRGVNAEEAKAVVAMARKAAAGHERDAGAQLVLAEAEYDVENYAAAEAAAERAIAANPKSPEALIYKVMARMAVLSAGDSAPADWRALRTTILAANRIEPDHPIPLALYYRSFIEAGEAPTTNAKDALIQAHHLAPSDMGLRINAAAMLISENRTEEAIATLRPLAYHPHAGGAAKQAQEMIAQINGDDGSDDPEGEEGAAPASAAR